MGMMSPCISIIWKKFAISVTPPQVKQRCPGDRSFLINIELSLFEFRGFCLEGELDAQFSSTTWLQLETPLLLCDDFLYIFQPSPPLADTDNGKKSLATPATAHTSLSSVLFVSWSLQDRRKLNGFFYLKKNESVLILRN